MTRPSRILLDHLAEIVAGIDRGRIAVRFRQPLIDLVTRHLDAAEGRRQSALDRSRERSARKRQAIRDDATHLLAERPDLNLEEALTMVHKRLRTLGKPADLRTIRDELTSLGHFRSGTPQNLCDVRCTSTTAST